MKNFVLLVLYLISALSLQADDDDLYLLRTAPGALNRVVNRYGLEVKKALPAQNLYLVKPSDDDDDGDFEERVKGDRDVISVEESEELFAPEIKSGSTNPHEEPLQQALQGRRIVDYFGARAWEGYTKQVAAGQIGLWGAQSRARTGVGVVAVIDTGVDASHPALRGSLVDGYDFTTSVQGVPTEWSAVDADVKSALSQSTTAFIDNSTSAVPINNYAYAALSQSTTAFIDTGKLPQAFGHGTMVASVVRLVAPTAKIMPLKAFQADGSSNTFDLISAIYYATDNGATIINMSFNMKASSAELDRAIRYASDRKVVLVASVGNDGNEILVYPAAYPEVKGVASLDKFSMRSGFSNYGPMLVTLAAPGEGLIVAYPGGNYASAWGTSFSAPMVAGAISLLKQVNPSWTAAQIEMELKRSARPANSYGVGAGMLFVGQF